MENKTTRVIVGYEATGKGKAVERLNHAGLKAELIMVKPEKESMTEVKERILSNEFDVIFLQDSSFIRTFLEENEINFELLLPEITMKNEWVGRLVFNGKDRDYILDKGKRWAETITNAQADAHNMKHCIKLVSLRNNETITDVLFTAGRKDSLEVKKPVLHIQPIVKIGNGFESYACPNCKKLLTDTRARRCAFCNQELDWLNPVDFKAEERRELEVIC